MNNNRRRIYYRPSKMQGIITGIISGFFVILGITVVIPNAGLFGIVWTLVAVFIGVSNLRMVLGKKYAGPEVYIEDDMSGAESAEARFEKLQRLYDSRMITQEEFEAKRAEILRDI